MITDSNRLTYTWLEQGRPAKIPAPSYIVRVQRWIVGKIHDPHTFPTDPPPSYQTNAYMSADSSMLGSQQLPSSQASVPVGSTTNPPQTALANEWIGKSSGFPSNYHNDVKSIVKQMFRCYAHLYHNHWDNPFWHINRHLELNSCFVHFMTVTMYYDLLPKKDIEPLQGLVDIFVSQGVIPKEAVAQHTS